MAKVRPENTVAKKDNTMVARTRVNELVGDKPNFSKLRSIPDVFSGHKKTITKKDSARYELGFREQIGKDKKAGKPTEPSTSFYDQMNQGRREASERRINNDLKNGALVRDSTIPLAPTQFPD